MNTIAVNTLLAGFKSSGISMAPGPGLNAVLQFQDEIGHSDSEGIHSFYVSLDQPQRKVFLWAAFATLCPETAIEVLRATVLAEQRKRYMQDFEMFMAGEEAGLQAKYDALAEAQRRFEVVKRPVHKRLKAQRDEIARLKRSVAQLQHEKKYLQSRVKAGYDDNQKARKYDKLRNLLGILS